MAGRRYTPVALNLFAPLTTLRVEANTSASLATAGASCGKFQLYELQRVRSSRVGIDTKHCEQKELRS